MREMKIREKWYFGLGQHEHSCFQLQVKSLSILRLMNRNSTARVELIYALKRIVDELWR